MEFSLLSAYISQLSILLPVILFIAKKENIRNPNLKILGILLFTSILFDLAGYASAKMFQSNIIVSNLYFLVQFLLLSWMYWNFYGKEKKQFIKIGAIIFTSIFLINSIFGQGLFVLQSYTNTASSVILIIIAYRFYRVLQNLPTIITKKLTEGRDVHFKTFYYINVGVFLYFVFNLWLFSLNPIVLEIFNEEAPVNLWVIHNVANIVKNVFFALGLYWAGRKELE